MAKVALETLNKVDAAAFVQAIGEVFEHSPWVAERAAAHRPFSTVEALHGAMFAEVARAPFEAKREFVACHPELSGEAMQSGRMTADSVSEQQSAGLDRMAAADLERFGQLNAQYRCRFGFPFVLCVRRHTRASILAEFARRVAADPESEFEAALREIFYITRLRVTERVDGPGLPKVHGHLSTHVLDTQAGRPAAGVRIELRDLSDGEPGMVLKVGITNADGRTEEALIGDQPLRIGTYQLTFFLADYFRSHGVPLATPPFLHAVPLRFAIAEPEGDYHVPLLCTPWSYSTYRGS
jgi:2-oxo-4-hydroxy-4-carboxy-5-ureidoimidazoline decarboxylase